MCPRCTSILCRSICFVDQRCNGFTDVYVLVIGSPAFSAMLNYSLTLISCLICPFCKYVKAFICTVTCVYYVNVWLRCLYWLVHKSKEMSEAKYELVIKVVKTGRYNNVQYTAMSWINLNKTDTVKSSKQEYNKTWIWMLWVTDLSQKKSQWSRRWRQLSCVTLTLLYLTSLTWNLC